jgi:mRNA-degrading endonuclease YafQ of YafQ-DinJ toxin-antitoxin module
MSEEFFASEEMQGLLKKFSSEATVFFLAHGVFDDQISLMREAITYILLGRIDFDRSCTDTIDLFGDKLRSDIKNFLASNSEDAEGEGDVDGKKIDKIKRILVDILAILSRFNFNNIDHQPSIDVDNLLIYKFVKTLRGLRFISVGGFLRFESIAFGPSRNFIKDTAKIIRDAERLTPIHQEVGEYIKKHEEIKQEYQAIIDAAKDENYKANFNRLYNAFSTFAGTKAGDVEKKGKNIDRFKVVILIPIVLNVLLTAFLIVTESHELTSNLLRMTGSVIGLELILIYFFRIALLDLKSDKAQLLQLELRKSLCHFIKNYVDYAKESIPDGKVSLDKFESIIFSSIVGTEEKMPSTFDGVEQLAKLIKSVNGTGK